MAGASAILERDTTSSTELDAAVAGVEQSEAAWTAYVAQHPRATGYHEWAWRTVFTRAFGCEPIYISARRGERIVGVLPAVFLDSWLFGRSLISLPYLNYGGVIADDAAAERVLFEYALSITRQKRCRHVELRHVEQHFSDLPCKRHKVTMLLPLQPSAPMWEALDRKVRNQVRKAQKSELTYASGGSELLREFYEVFARNMRDLGTPVYARRFFEEMLAAFPDRARIHVVSLKTTPVAAGFTFETRGTVEIPWASSVRDLPLDAEARIDPGAARYAWFDYALRGAKRPALLAAKTASVPIAAIRTLRAIECCSEVATSARPRKATPGIN